MRQPHSMGGELQEKHTEKRKASLYSETCFSVKESAWRGKSVSKERPAGEVDLPVPMISGKLI